MNLLLVRAELEEERTWRADEMRFLHNQMPEQATEEERDRYRRAILLLLYAHFEGFCKVALLIYVKALNSQGLRCGDVTPAVAAATCRPILQALSDHNQKNDFFRKAAPLDEKLHFAWRSQEFIARLNEVLGSAVSIPDTIVDTESNLWPVVLKKNLFKLGFDVDSLNQYDGSISNLVNRRNGIGHGLDRSGIAGAVYDKLQGDVYDVMDNVMSLVTTALAKQSYLASPIPVQAGIAVAQH